MMVPLLFLCTFLSMELYGSLFSADNSLDVERVAPKISIGVL